jgi:hypothetical protein
VDALEDIPVTILTTQPGVSGFLIGDELVG